MTNKSNNRPDFDLYVNVGSEDKPRTRKIGAAWKHTKGDGMNLVFEAFPITGKAVAFPSKEEDTEPED